MRNKENVSAYNRLYRQKNKEKIKALQDDYYQKHRLERIENARNWTKRNKDRALLTRREYMKTPQGRLTSIKGSAKTRKIEYFLQDDIAISIMEQPCFYCGSKDSIGIDRIDSDIGYTDKNCVPCCSMCNYMKKDFPQKEFIERCMMIASHVK